MLYPFLVFIWKFSNYGSCSPRLSNLVPTGNQKILTEMKTLLNGWFNNNLMGDGDLIRQKFLQHFLALGARWDSPDLAHATHLTISRKCNSVFLRDYSTVCMSHRDVLHKGFSTSVYQMQSISLGALFFNTFAWLSNPSAHL